MRTFTITALAAALAFAPAFAFAAPPAPASSAPGAPAAGTSLATRPAAVDITPADSGILRQRDNLDNQIEILERQAKIAELQKKISDASAAPVVVAPAAPLVVPPTNLASSSTVAVSSAILDNPAHVDPPALRLVGLVVVGDAAQATILDHGVPFKAREGTQLPSGWRVTAITTSGATIVKGHARRHLSVGG